MTTLPLTLEVDTTSAPVDRTCAACGARDGRPVHILLGGEGERTIHVACHTGCASCADARRDA